MVRVFMVVGILSGCPGVVAVDRAALYALCSNLADLRADPGHAHPAEDSPGFILSVGHGGDRQRA